MKSSDEIIDTLNQAKQLIKCRGSKNKFLIRELVTDHRKISSHETLFIAYQGIKVDGHQFIKKAIQAGASIIVYDSDFDEKIMLDHSKNILFLQVHSSRAVWSFLSALFHDNPQRDLIFYGVTGTNGKTSTAWLLHHMLTLSNIDSVLIGTLGIYGFDQPIIGSHTTPDPDFLFSILKLAKEQNKKNILMEVSSHGIAQGKIAPLKFNGLAFTSFSQDHLDFHSNLDEYFSVKKSFFSNYKKDNSARQVFSQNVFFEYKINDWVEGSDIWVYGRKGLPMYGHAISYHVKNADLILEGQFETRGKFPFIGNIYIENFLCAQILFHKITGKYFSEKYWLKLPQVPGRLERVSVMNRNTPQIFVDYAHTPDGLEKVLLSMREESPKKLWVVFGCGGDRDKKKRPLMAQVAEKYADEIILTWDNPRKESPEQIIEDILSGFSEKAKNKIKIEHERAKAIEFAVKNADPSDYILIAGKGHEDYQIIGDQKIHFDDREIAKNLLR